MLSLAVPEPKQERQKQSQEPGDRDLWVHAQPKGSYVVLPENALAVAVGFQHHVCRLGFADGHQAGLDGWEILSRGKTAGVNRWN